MTLFLRLNLMKQNNRKFNKLPPETHFTKATAGWKSTLIRFQFLHTKKAKSAKTF